MDLLHYIPAFTHIVRGSQRAACGRYVGAREHSVEPSCPECAAWLASKNADDNETAKALEAEFPADFRGKLGVEPHHEFDETDLALGKDR